MYSDALSTSLLQLCEMERLSYETAAERIGCSSRYFGRLIRKESSPTLKILERICEGFQQTPNEILRLFDKPGEILYRLPLLVDTVRAYPDADLAFPVCPRCGKTMEREYQRYCDRCGQSLSWKRFRHAAVIPFSRTDMKKR